ncbi:acyltransferase domain-containing protein, partial [Streptomyces sp. NPDC002640]
AMLAVQAGEDVVRPLLEGLEERVSLAAVNGPASVVVSGAADAVAQVASQLTEQGVRTRELVVSHAFHSPLMDPMLAEFRTVAEGVTFHTPVITLVSTLTGEVASAQELASPDYWVSHARGAVRFHDAVRALQGLGVSRFVEIGPDATLTALTRTALGDDAVCVPSVRKDRAEDLAVLQALGLVGDEAGVDWRAVYGPNARIVDLPTYPFQRERYWLETVRYGRVPASEALGAATEAAEPAPVRPWSELSEEEMVGHLLALVREHAADVLGHADPDAIGASENFVDMGFSSFTALEVRNRLCEATGLLIPPVAMYDHPTPGELAEFLRNEVMAAAM